jgi:hypothetical protein
VARRQPDPNTRSGSVSSATLAFASAVTIADTVDGSVGPLILIRAPVANSISMSPAGTGGSVLISASRSGPAIATAAKAGGD